MITFTNFTGLVSSVILIASLAMMLLQLLKIPRPYVTGVTVLVAIIVCLPIPSSGLPLAAYVRGAIGELSITLLVLLVLKLLMIFAEGQLMGKAEKVLLWALILLGALVLYPMALGIGYVDSYRWGFGNMWLLAVLFIIAALAFWKRFYIIALCIALAVLAWSVGWNEAKNLWHYLLDPLVTVYAVSALIWHCGQKLRGYKSTFAWRGGVVSPLD